LVEDSTAPQPARTWLVLRSGPLAGARYQLKEGVQRIGRAPDNDIIVQGQQSATVSLYHLEIVCDGGRCRIRDVGSTNGTYVDGEQITDAELRLQSVIRLGNNGPEFAMMPEPPETADLDRTLVVPAGIVLPAALPEPDPAGGGHETLLSEAVQLARRARGAGVGDQTLTLMRKVLSQALRRNSGRFRLVIAGLVAALLCLSAFGFWRFSVLKREKRAIDDQIRQVESRLAMDETPQEAERLISELSTYQNEARSLERSVLYRYALRQKESFINQEIRTIMAEFGAETYSVPPEFEQRVNQHIEQYRGPDRQLMEHALSQAGGKLTVIRAMLEADKLPLDLAYIPLVESALMKNQVSAAGAAGPWQLTPASARALGLRVDAGVDERLDLHKATRAGCRYLRNLILDFGAGSSVMLALAAYNLGPTRVKQAITKVEDPIKQRDFWYLYRARALPAETREYVPKVFAAIIIGRNPDRFGFLDGKVAP
jgi:pSer/pThr/pTyr-binding forkhead associated (FHA) protein